MKKILLDTDAGVSDVLALLLLLRSPDLAKCVGITIVAGNTHLPSCVGNVRRALGVASFYRDGRTADVKRIPVSVGAAEPLSRELLKADEVHGTDGLGGAFHHDGNTSARAEFNIRVDPEAAQIVLDSGMPITMVPLDCTEQARLIASDMAGEGPVHAFARRATGVIMEFYRRFEGFEGVYHHDPLAVGVALDPSLAFGVHAHVAVETKGELTTGETVAMLRRQRGLLNGKPSALVCLHPDVERFQTMFRDRVLPPAA